MRMPIFQVEYIGVLLSKPFLVGTPRNHDLIKVDLILNSLDCDDIVIQVNSLQLPLYYVYIRSIQVILLNHIHLILLYRSEFLVQDICVLKLSIG